MSKNTSDRDGWTAWKIKNADKLVHPAGFEEKFVDLVLSRVPGLEPDDVIPQFAFKDNAGRSRRIDFVILDDEKGYLLPIELDGASKDALGPQWSDFLDRQNSLLASFGTVLRYSNAKMFNNASSIIREIAEHLAVQAAARLASDQRQAVLAGFIASAGRRATPHKAAKRASFWKPAGIAASLIVLGAGVGVFMMNNGAVWSWGSHSAREHITPAQASAHIGQRRRVCGLVAGIHESPAGRFINFDRRYPDQTMTAVIWARDVGVIGDAGVKSGGTLCVEGLLKEYNKKPSITVTDAEQFSP